MTPSPFAQAARPLIALGYSVIPILPVDAPFDSPGQAPGEFRAGAWRMMSNWPQYRDRRPTEFELSVWCSNWPGANVGVVLGSPVGLNRLIAVDIDTKDPDEFEAILRAIPASPMSKKGSKGLTLFYQAPPDIKSRGYKVGVRPAQRTLVDLLTGNQTRQTVVPPSLHPLGMAYAWVAGPVPASDLPLFDEDSLAVLEETLESLGWGAETPGTSLQKMQTTPRDADEPPTVWRDLNDAALTNLPAWVEALELFGLRSSRRGGYEAVATWRESNTGRPLDKRKRNLQLHPTGIKDFGDDGGLTALDVVQRARGCDLDEAFAWLSGRLGRGLVVALESPVVVRDEASGALINASTGELVEPVVDAAGELPDALTRAPGLVGDITDWICATARKPSRVLAFGAALVVVGTAVGRMFAGPTRTGTHLYVLPLGPTGVGKDHPLNQIARCMQQSGLGHLLGPSEFISMPAAIKFLGRAPLSICPMDEIGVFLKRVNNRNASGFEGAISGVLRTAWGKSFATMKTPEWAQVESRTINAPAMSLYGPSTSVEFYASLAAADASNGVLNRFLVMETRTRAAERDPDSDPADVPESIRERLRDLYNAKGELWRASTSTADADVRPTIVPWASADARAIYTALAKDVERRADLDVTAAAFMGRTVEMAQRIATIVALGRDGAGARVSVSDMTLGRDVAVWSAETMMEGAAEHMAENEQQQSMKLILNLIRGARTMSRTALVKRVNGRIDVRAIDNMLKGLIDGEMIYEARQQSPKGGPPKRLYVYGAPPDDQTSE